MGKLVRKLMGKLIEKGIIVPFIKNIFHKCKECYVEGQVFETLRLNGFGCVEMWIFLELHSIPPSGYPTLRVLTKDLHTN